MDFERISLLLHVAEKASGHPQLQAIRDAALAELKTINDSPAPVADETSHEVEHEDEHD